MQAVWICLNQILVHYPAVWFFYGNLVRSFLYLARHVYGHTFLLWNMMLSLRIKLYINLYLYRCWDVEQLHQTVLFIARRFKMTLWHSYWRKLSYTPAIFLELSSCDDHQRGHMTPEKGSDWHRTPRVSQLRRAYVDTLKGNLTVIKLFLASIKVAFPRGDCNSSTPLVTALRASSYPSKGL